MGLLNKILTSANARLKITNLFGSSPATDTMEGLPLGTSDGTPTGEVCVKVLTIGATPPPPTPTANTFTALANVTVTGASTAIVSFLATRQSLTIQNTSATDTLYIQGVGAAVVGVGPAIPPGAGISLDCSGAINGISSGGNITVALWQTTSV